MGARAGRSRREAAGAVTAQFSQAAASFLLSVAALRSLKTADYGVLALLLGVLVVATALMTGFVGDSLTILNRHDDRIRAGLEIWALIIAVSLLVGGAIFGYSAGLLDPVDAALFGLSLAAFTLEDCGRRLLMANLRFWSVVATDLTYLVAAAVILLTARLTSGHLRLADFLIALVLGQALATGVAIALLPATDRRLSAWTDPAVRAVAQFGSWRAVQQTTRPAALTIVRFLVVIAAGRAALGHLEAARVYMSPTLLLAQGTGTFLLATYALDRHLSRRTAIRRSDRTSAFLVTLSAALSALAVLALPWLGGLLSGGSTAIDPWAAAGWGFYAAGAAISMPYISLASVRTPQRTVVGLRLVDTAASIILATALLAVGTSPSFVPFALGAGILFGAALQRWVSLSSARVLPEPTEPAVV
jgi:O-antigen/teichoic acid export membrane protein